MELNKKKVKRETKAIVNPEGSIVNERPKEIQLYLEASNLKLKENDFYITAKDKLDEFLKLAKENDVDYRLGLSKFLADKGLKLSPVVLLSTLADEKFSFSESGDLNYIFNTPARIAEAVSLNNLKLVHLNNSFKKKILKQALENMSEETLKKNKLRNRHVKLADLIKLLRPTPKNKKICDLYKAIIENSKESKLSQKANMLTVKSSTSIKNEDKKELIYDQVMNGKIPINQLIRNLKYLAENYDFKKQHELQSKIIAQLSGVKNYRFLNIFDIVQAAVYVPQFEKALFEIIQKFTEDVKKEFDFDKEATILFDVSGSMSGRGIDDGFRYLAVMSLLFNNVKIRFFSNNLVNEDIKDHQKIITDLKNGSYQKAKNALEAVFSRHSGGTALIQSTEDLLGEDSELKNLIVISDEVSWNEGDDLRDRINQLKKNLIGKNLILINPTVYKGTVFSENVLGIASLTSSILLDFALATNPKKFVEYVKKYKKE